MLFKLACRSDNMADKQPRVEEGGFRDRVRRPKESEKAYLSPSQHSKKKKGCVGGGMEKLHLLSQKGVDPAEAKPHRD